MSLYSDICKRLMLSNELVYRIAVLFNYILNEIVGKNSKNLDCDENTILKTGFDKKRLIKFVVKFLCNMTSIELRKNIINDQRSFNLKNYEIAADILEPKSSSDAISVSMRLSFFIISLKEYMRIHEDKYELNNFPDEFIDPIICSIMEDPMILPSSKERVDSNTMRSILLEDNRDPFTRHHLNIEECKRDHILKARIERFLAESKN